MRARCASRENPSRAWSSVLTRRYPTARKGLAPVGFGLGSRTRFVASFTTASSILAIDLGERTGSSRSQGKVSCAGVHSHDNERKGWRRPLEEPEGGNARVPRGVLAVESREDRTGDRCGGCGSPAQTVFDLS